MIGILYDLLRSDGWDKTLGSYSEHPWMGFLWGFLQKDEEKKKLFTNYLALLTPFLLEIGISFISLNLFKKERKFYRKIFY